MTRPRDTQFSKFWRAARVLTPFDQQFKTEKGLEGFVRRSAARAFLQRRYQLTAPIGVEHLPARQREKASYWSVGVPVDRRDLRTVVYCLTRVLWYRTHSASAFTGWQWAAIYLDVVQALMGRPAADLLKASYRTHGVRWREKKTVEVTPEMRSRLAKARERRKKVDNSTN